MDSTDCQVWKRKSFSIQKFPPVCIKSLISQRAQEDSDVIVILHRFKDHRPLKSLNKIHHFNDFTVYSSVSFSISMMLGRHHNLTPLTLPLPWQPLTTPCPGLWVSAYEFAYFGHFIYLELYSMWASVVSFFYLNNVFKVHLCYTMYQNFILSLWVNNRVYGGTMLCLSDYSVDRCLGCSWFGAIMNDNFMNIHAQVFVWTYVLGSLGIAKSYGNSMFNFLRDFQDHSFYILWNPKWKMTYTGSQRQATSVPGWRLSGSTNLGMFL